MKTCYLLFFSLVYFFAPGYSVGQENKNADDVFMIVEEMPVFPGGEDALREYIMKNLNYPEKAKNEGISGKVYVTFVVDENGKVADPKIARGVDPMLDKEAIRVVNSLPTWTPGKQRGKVVKVAYTVPINFVLDNAKKGEEIYQNEDGVFLIVEEMPEFPGGTEALKAAIVNSIKYPEQAVKNKISGKVYIQFIVEENGQVTNAKVVRGVNPLLDKEALRVVSQLPVWTPGKQRGKAVKVSYTIPVEFALN